MISWLESLRNSDKLKIVEGKKDILALESFGIKNIRQLDKPLYSFIEEVSSNNSEVIILTDLDQEGRRLYSILRHNLQKRKVKIDNYFREYLFKNTKLTQIEGIKRYVKKGYLL